LPHTHAVETGQMAELRAWAQALERESTSEEARAAARAILLLAHEVDRLSAELAAAARTAAPHDGDDDWPDEPPTPSQSRFGAFRQWLSSPVGAGREVSERRARRRLELSARLAAPDLHAQGPPPGAVLGPTALKKLAFA